MVAGATFCVILLHEVFMNDLIFKCIFGSRLFGVTTPDSDTDIKGVYCASFEQLVLGQTGARSVNNGKEGKDKVEEEYHSIRTFCSMVEQGQTLTYSLLFAPENYWLHAAPEWLELVENRHRLVSRQVLPFISYARSQAQKCSLKGERLRTLKEFVRTLTALDGSDLGSEGRLLPETFELLEDEFRGSEGVRLRTEQTASMEIRQIEVCGKSFGETTPLKLWVGPLQSLLNRYGKRAMGAMESEGSDLKAMYHAVRLTGEINELLRTGKITYPRPDAELLMTIRQGRYSNGEVAEMIDVAVEEGNLLLKTTTLQEKPDRVWLQDWMLRTQARHLGLDWTGSK